MSYPNSRFTFNNCGKKKNCNCTSYYYDRRSFCNECISIGAKLNGESITLTKSFWDYSKKNPSERIAYNNNFKVNKIKRILEKCDTEEVRVKNELNRAEVQLSYLKMLETYFVDYRNKVEHNKYFDNYIRYILEEKQNCIGIYIIYVNYYNKIPSIKDKYNMLLKAIKSKNMCYECFNVVKTGIKTKKSKNYCIPCFNKMVNKTIIRECPVCYEKFDGNTSELANCGNSHYFCNSCYSAVKKYSNKCPMCRGAL